MILWLNMTHLTAWVRRVTQAAGHCNCSNAQTNFTLISLPGFLPGHNDDEWRRQKKNVYVQLYITPNWFNHKSLGKKKTVVIHRTYKSRSRLINPFKSNKFLVVTSPMAAQSYCQTEIQIWVPPSLDDPVLYKIDSLLCCFWQVWPYSCRKMREDFLSGSLI